MGPTESVQDRQSPRACRRRPAAAAIALIAGILIAGCGGGAGSGVASVSSSSTSSSNSSSTAGGGSTALGGGPSSASGAPRSGFSIQTANPQKALKFSQCMRANGVAGFPDPNGQGVIQGSGIDPNSAQFQKAQKTCSKDIGGGLGTRSPAQIAKAEAAALAFSKCMRSHGVSDFPDPQFGSGGSIRISLRAPGHGGTGGGLDPSSQIFQKAQQSCNGLLIGPGGPKKLAP